jgi:hypothetical protein
MAICEKFYAAVKTVESPVVARLMVERSKALSQNGRQAQAYEAAVEALAVARATGDPDVLGETLDEYARAATFARKHHEVLAVAAEAEALPNLPARIRLSLLNTKAISFGFEGDLDAEVRLGEQAREGYRLLGNIRSEFGETVNLAEAEYQSGHPLRAIELSREMLPVARQLGVPTPSLQLNLGAYLTAIDDLAGALESVRTGIAIASTHEPEHFGVAIGIEHMALIAALAGDFARAARLEGYADAALSRAGFAREYTEQTAHDRLGAVLRDGLRVDELERLKAEGAALAPKDAIALALTTQLCDFGRT